MKYLLLIALTLAFRVTLRAQPAVLVVEDDTIALSANDERRVIERATLYGGGYTNAYDTYLSPQEYRGVEGRVLRESMRTVRLWGHDYERQTLFQGNVGYTHNRVDNNNTILALVNWSVAWHRSFSVAPGLRLMVGPAVDFNGGFVYNMRNGNNPAQARAYVNLDAAGMAVYDIRLWGQPFRLRYQLKLPFVGLMFSPHYGQSYYEIFSVGHTSGIVNLTSLHNQPSLRQMFSIDFPVGRARMRFAYMCDLQQSSLHSIDTHTYSHIFMLGFVHRLFRIKNEK